MKISSGYIDRKMIFQPTRAAKKQLARASVVLTCLVCAGAAIATASMQEENAASEAALPVSAKTAQIFSYPLDVIETVEEIITAWTARRKEYNGVLEENAILKSLLAREKLRHHDYQRLKSLMDYQEIYPHEYVSARAVGFLDRGPKDEALAILDKKALPEGKGPFAVINELGLVGRTVGYKDGAARIMLLTDVNSRVPVTVGGKFRRAIMAGANDKKPRLEFIGEEHGVRAGDYVMTSGDGGIFPPDLFVGRVELGDNGALYVDPYVTASELRHVSIVLDSQDERDE